MKSKLGRCLTPNVRKQKFLHQLAIPTQTITNKPITYDSFTYMDRVTNKKILVGDVRACQECHTPRTSEKNNKNRKTQRKKLIHGTNSSTKEMEEINQCLNFMKSTKVFQKLTLKKKLMNKSNEQSSAKKNDASVFLKKKKKKLKQCLNKYMKEKMMGEFRNYLDGKRVNPTIIQLSKNLPHKMTKKKIQQIIDQFVKKPPENIEANIRDSDISDLDFEGEDLFRLFDDHLKVKMKQMEYLVKPPPCRQLYHHIYHEKHNFKKTYHFQNNDIHSMHFKGFSISESVQDLKKACKNQVSLTEKEEQIIMAIENGDFLQFLGLLVTKSTLIHTVDSRKNTLLHTAAKYDQVEMFDFLVKKLGYDMLHSKNNVNKKPIHIAKLFGSQRILQWYEKHT